MDLVPYAAFFPYIHPCDADNFSLVSKAYRTWILHEYLRVGRDAVVPGGIWHHQLCKRARDSIFSSKPNFRPLALGSLVDNRCIVCRKSYMAKVSFWGFAAHPACIRPFLLNTYYIPEKFGLQANHLRILPQETLNGYNYVMNSYSYKVVFEGPSRRFVPKEWTLEHAAEIYAADVHDFFEKKRKKAQAIRKAKERKHRRTMELQEKRTAALAKRQQMIDTHPMGSIIRRVHQAMGQRFMGDFLGPLVTPHTKWKTILETAPKYDFLLQHLHPKDIHGPDDDLFEVVREKVEGCIVDIINVIGKTQYKIQDSMCLACRQNLAAAKCYRGQCGWCCPGCSRHKSNKTRFSFT